MAGSDQYDFPRKPITPRPQPPQDASKEAYLDWWEDDTHHVVHGTKGSIDSLRFTILQLIQEPKFVKDETLENLSMSCLFGGSHE